MIIQKDPNSPIYSNQQVQANQSNPYSNQQMNPYADVGKYLRGFASGGVGTSDEGVSLGQNLPGGGQGDQFTAERKAQALQALRGGLSSDEGDIYNRNQLRGALGQAIQNYGPNQEARMSQFQGQQERNLSNSLSQMRQQMGGTGLSGSLQGGRALGDIMAQSQRANNEGMLGLNLQAGQELGQLSGVGQNILNQGLSEREFGLKQSKTLADLLQQQGMQEQQSILATREAPGPSDFERYLGMGLDAGGKLGGAAMMKSDINLKENIVPANEKIEDFLDSLAPYAYKYKNDRFGVGTHISVMAQDLEKTATGKALVIETPEGKMVDYGKAFGLMLATNVYLHNEIKKLKEG